MADQWKDIPGSGLTHAHSLAEARRMLHAHGIAVTRQRLSVLAYLRERPGHPDADEVYQAMTARGAAISLASVYNTLRLFAEKGLVTPVELDENRLRFDADLTPHGHFRCTACGRIDNFPCDVDALPANGLDGYVITRRDVNFHGICKGCLNQQKEEPYGQGQKEG